MLWYMLFCFDYIYYLMIIKEWFLNLIFIYIFIIFNNCMFNFEIIDFLFVYIVEGFKLYCLVGVFYILKFV